MTTAERLVKNICDQRRELLIKERNEQIERVSEDVPFRQLPKPVKNAFRRLVRLRPQVKIAENVIERHGYRSDLDEGRVPSVVEVRRNYNQEDKMKREVRLKYEQRLRQVENLYTTARIHVMGMPHADARGYLIELRKQLDAL